MEKYLFSSSLLFQAITTIRKEIINTIQFNAQNNHDHEGIALDRKAVMMIVRNDAGILLSLMERLFFSSKISPAALFN
ncbi:hypothetical protein [Bacillus sp. P14.5]|uniref:hypothetical protein n=1 Tax=Bacillus sp. P14.5 TaxID=1983400 RepID=UPI0013B05527|nr:hypothetical protein [Bacillus sp. P14.5]